MPAARPPRPAEPSTVDLPLPSTPLVGREAEVARVAALLSAGDTRLVTLTGPGGIGKTRLALAVAAEIEADYADGACFVTLAATSDPDLVPVAVAEALGLRESGTRSADELVLDALRERHLLLVLDNLEHLGESVAVWVGELCRRCPLLTVLATSRIALRLTGEHRYPVPALTLPATSLGDADALVNQSAAVDLFVQRARALQPDFALTPDTAATVADICRALDGLPLAIELAAARLHVLSPASLLARLADRLTVLQGGPRDAPNRQQTMRDTIAWSHDLLSPAQQALFRRLSVFTGGFTLDAAEAVGGESAFGLISDLLDHSLLRRDSPEGVESRYRIFEVIREYGLERLEAAGETEIANDTWAAWCTGLANDAANGIQGPEQIAWLGRLDAELDNIRGALSWLQEQDRIPEAQDLAGAIAIYLLIRAHYTEARALFEALIAHPLGAAPSIGRAWCLCGLGTVVFNQGGDGPRSMAAFDESVAICRQLEARRVLAAVLPCRALPLMRTGRVDEAQADCEEAVALAQEDEYRWGEAAARAILGSVLHQRGDLEGARLEMQASIDLCLALGESWIRSVATGNLAISMMMQPGDLDLAEQYLEEGNRLMRLVGDRLNLGVSIVMRAEIVHMRGDAATAERLLHEALAVCQEMHDPYGAGHALRLLGVLAAKAGDVERALRQLREAIAQMSKLGAANDLSACLDGFVDLARLVGEPATAARLIGAADAALAAEGASRWDNRPGEHEDRVASIVAVLGADDYQAAWEAGHALSKEEMVAEALAWQPSADAIPTTAEPAVAPAPASGLSRREIEVLALLAEGLSNQQIADRLYLSRRTATSHVSNILAKLDLPSRTAAVAWALRNGIA